jgi:hypothetical protein
MSLDDLVAGALSRRSSPHGVIARIDPTPGAPHAMAATNGSWLSAPQKDGHSRPFSPPSRQPCGSSSVRRGLP